MKPKDRVKEICEMSGVSQAKFAESIGVKGASLSAVLSGKNRTTKTLANSIELVHGYRAEWILTGHEPKKSVPKQIDKNDQEMWELLNSLDEKLVGFSQDLVRFKAKVEQVRKD